MFKTMLMSLGALALTTVVSARNYTAGEVQSKKEVKYGRFEIMMYSSDVSGTTSTFFLWKNKGETPTSRWNELDIETFGKSPNKWQSNPIWQYNDNDRKRKQWPHVHGKIPIANTWVKFTLEWTPEYVAWFNNNVEVRRIAKGENAPVRAGKAARKDPVSHIADPMRMAFNHWSTFPGKWLGPWDDNDLPSFQFVDWMTYRPWNGSGFDDVTIRYDFNSMKEITDNFYVSDHTFSINQCQFSDKGVGVVNGFMWLGMFKRGQELVPKQDQIPDAPSK